MNNRKEQIKKAAAFVSALSFMSVTNFSGLNNSSALMISKVSAVNSTDNTDGSDGIISEETDKPQITTTVETSTTVETTSSSTTITTVATTTTAETTTTTAEVPEALSRIRIRVTDKDIREDIVKRNINNVKFGNIGDNIKEINFEYMDGSPTDVITISYDSSEISEEDFKKEFEKDFSYITEDSIYTCADGGMSYDYIFRKNYYCFYNESNGMAELLLNGNDDNIRTENGKVYLKINQKFASLIKPAAGYHFETKASDTINDVVYIDKDTVKIGKKAVLSIVENTIAVNIDAEKVDTNWGMKSTIKMSEIYDKKITLTCHNGYNAIKIGDSTVESGTELSVKDLIEKAGYTITDGVVKNGDGVEVPEVNIPVVGVPASVKIKCTIDGKEEEITCKTEGNKILIPFTIKKGNDDYYLSGYSYTGNVSSQTFDDVYKELDSGKRYKEVPYGEYVYATYENIDDSAIEISREEVINALTSADGNTCSVRNDSVIDFSGAVATFDFNKILKEGEELSEEEKTKQEERKEQLNGIKLIFENDKDGICVLTFSDTLKNNLNLNLNQKVEFYKLVSILDSQNQSISFGEPVYIYFDQTNPTVKVDDEYKADSAPWSQDSYEFTFTVNDGKSTEEVAEDLKGDYEKINNNPDLKSVKSIKIDGTVFYTNNDGEWVKDNKNTSQDKNISVDNLTFSTDKNGTGTFTATFKSEESVNKKINISATDNCGNTSADSAVIKIDNDVPLVNDINIEGINENNNIKDTATVNVDIEDADSGIKSVVFRYGNKEFFKSEDNSENKIYTGILNIDGNDSVSKVEVIVTDNAENAKTYYYKKDEKNGNVTESVDDAADVVMDNQSPVVNVSAPEKADYTEITDDKNEKRWYNHYPEISIASEDNKRVKQIIITINGTEIKKDVDEIISAYKKPTELTDKEVSDLLKNLKLVFIPLDTDNQKFHVNVSDGGENNFPLTGDVFTLYNGKLEVNVSVNDYADNSSSDENAGNKANEIIYIDNNAPTTSGVIECENPENPDVHFKSFGTFAKGKVTVKVDLKDEKVSSGINKENVKINFAGSEYDVNEIKDGYIWFEIPSEEIPENSSITGQIKLTGHDNVGNELIFEVNEYSKDNILVNDKGNADVTIENIKPVIEFSVTGDNRYDDGEKVWYSSDVTVKCTVKDDEDGDSGLSYVDFKRNQYNAATQETSDNQDYSSVKTTESKTHMLSTEEGRDGEAVFTIDATDNAGNHAKTETTVYKDITAPSVTRFEFYNPVLSRSPASIIMGRIEHFGYFFDSATSMTVYAEDKNKSSGMKSVYCRLINSDGTVFMEEHIDNPSYSDGTYYAEFEIPEGFKGDILAWAVDNVNNKSTEVSPDGLASENQSRHDSHASISIEIPQTEYSDTSGLPLYNNDVTASVVIDDDFSGIKTVEWTTSDFDGWQRIDIDDNGNIYGDSDSWSVDRSERNIALSVSNNITVSRDSNDNIIIVRITDNSGNVSENEVNFSIDKQAPVIAVSGIEQSQGVKYYNSDRQAHIVISERNFTSPMVNGKPEGFQDDPDSPAGTDNFRHIKDIVYNSDGTYSLEIENTDLAGNVANKYSSGTFVIDKTAPVLEVEFSKQSGGKADPKKNGYINDVVSAVISVEELNFDSGRVSVKINGKEYTPEEWKEKDGKYTAVIPYDEFKKDGEYTVSISGTDLASNAFKSYSASFVIDTESPEIEFSGFETANKGEVAPVIKIDDLNLDEYELNVYRNGRLCKMSYDSAKEVYSFKVSDNNDCITGKWLETTVDGNVHKEFVFDNFPSDECFDGLYSIDISATDKAENVSNDMRKFSVNRFGSVFEVENIENIDGKYLNKAPNISITETNVDKHKKDSEIIVILDKGSVTEQLDETMYEVSEPEMLDDKSGYVYKYVIKAGNFNQDLDYRISIQTIDEAGNKNVSTGRGAEFGFNVDTHDPEFKCDELVERAEFRESEKNFRINVNEKLKHITVTTSLDEVLLDFDADDDDRSDNSYTFVMPASNTSRSVTVELTDLAGNKTVETFNNLLITENMFLYLFHKTWIKVTGGIALLGIGTVGGFTVTGKKRRRRN